MTQTPTKQQPQPPQQGRAHFVVPAKHPMVTVLGSGDALLRVIEQAFPDVDIHVRGNEITATGDRAEVELVQRLFDDFKQNGNVRIEYDTELYLGQLS